MGHKLRAVDGQLATVPNQRPIVIGHYTLSATGLEVDESRGRPSFDEHEGVGDFITRAVKTSKFWLGDWLRYGESRQDWQARLEQAEGDTGLTQRTLQNIRAVAGSVPVSRRREGVAFSLHAEVAALGEADQVRWLDKAKAGSWDRRELREAIRASQRATVLEGRAETMHTIEVSVLVEVEASTPFMASQIAWDEVKGCLKGCPRPAKVIAAHARPR